MRPLIRFVAALCVVPLLALHAPTAEAAGGHLEFSLDGRSWTATPPTSLFEQQMMLVPGASSTTILHLRSTAGTSGLLFLAIDEVRFSDVQSAHHFELTAETAAGIGLDQRRFAELDRNCVGSPQRIAPGQQTAVTLTISLDARTSGTDAQMGWVDFALAVGFVDAAAQSSGENGEDSCGPVSDFQVPALPPVDPAADDDAAIPAAHGPSAAEDPATKDAAARTPGRAAPREQHGLLAITGTDLWTVGLFGVGMLAAGSLLLGARRRAGRS